MSNERAFTLIEIAIAIAIFGIALSTLMASTTRLMDTSFSEVQRSRASVFAAYLLEVELLDSSSSSAGSNNPGMTNPNTGQGNAIQSDSSPLDGLIPAKSGKLVSHLNQAGYFDSLNQREDFPYLNDSWHYELKNEPLELALLPVPPQHIKVTVSWGKHESEQYILEAILPPPKSSATSNAINNPSQSGTNSAGSNNAGFSSAAINQLGQ